MAYYNIMKAARGWAVCIVGGGYAVKRWRCGHWHLSTASRLRATAQHREPATPLRIGNGFADATSETYCRFSVFFIAVAW